MRGFNTVFLVVILLILDIYVFMAVRAIVGNSARTRGIVFGVYWTISAIVLITILVMPYLHFQDWPVNTRSVILTIIFGLVFAKLLIAVFMLLDDLRRGVQWIIRRFSAATPASELPDITRSRF